MREIKGDIWDFHREGYWIVIPTNGFVKKNGECVMGRGLAWQAKQRYPNLPRLLGEKILLYGNSLFTFPEYHLITFPVKRVWWEKADLTLIDKSANILHEMFFHYGVAYIHHINTPVFLPWVGCGNGGLDKKNVKPILEKYLDDRFMIVDNSYPERVRFS
jgi:hypothetical protein